MLMVVFWHTQLTYGKPFFRFAGNLFATVQMPIFFFLSGYMIYSVAFDRRKLMTKTGNRLRTILWPTILFFTLYVFFFSCPPWMEYSTQHRLIDTFIPDLKNSIFTIWKSGYWYTFTFVAISLAAMLFMHLCSTLKLASPWRVVALCFILIAFKAVYYRKVISFTHPYYDMATYLFSFELIDAYLIYFLLGMVAKMYQSQFTHLYQTHLTGGSFLGAAIIGILICYGCGVTLASFASLLSLASIIGLCYLLYWVMQKNIAILQRPLGWLTIVGTSTLEIYLIHYFLLSILATSHIRSLVYDPIIGTPIQGLYLLLLPFLVVYVCLLIVKLMKRFKLYCIAFPQ